MKIYFVPNLTYRLVSQIKLIEEGYETSLITSTDATAIRDYLMLLLCYTNCLRASNIRELTIYDVNAAEDHKDIDGAKIIYNKKYKVRFIFFLVFLEIIIK